MRLEVLKKIVAITIYFKSDTNDKKGRNSN